MGDDSQAVSSLLKSDVDPGSGQSSGLGWRRHLRLMSVVLLALSGIFGLCVLVTGFSHVHCASSGVGAGEKCGNIIHFQYFHYKNLLLMFFAVQSFGWFTHLEKSGGRGWWNISLSVVLLLMSAWVYGIVFHWDVLATFYFGHIAPYVVRFFLI